MAATFQAHAAPRAAPQQLSRRVDPSAQARGVLTRCRHCRRRLWLPAAHAELRSAPQEAWAAEQGASELETPADLSRAASRPGSVPARPPSRAEVVERIDKVVNLVRTADKLSPFDKSEFNVSLLIWRAVASIPAEDRPRLLNALLPADIRALWTLAGKRRSASAQQLQSALGPDYSLWDDFPEKPGQVAVYQGVAAVPLHTLLGRFKKSFFLHPASFELYGRVGVGKGALGDMLYSLFFKASVAPSVVPATSELADMSLEYLPPAGLGLAAADLPRGRGWRAPEPPRWPFGGGLVDYMRPVGPGVYVGAGWKAPREGRHELGRRFLRFLLVRQA